MIDGMLDTEFEIFVASIMMILMLLASIYGWDALCEWWEQRHARPASRPFAVPSCAVRQDRGSSPPSLPILPHREWVCRANDLPHVAPHLLIVGKSGSGKTTLARAILSFRRGQIVIITPKPDDV